ncbi:hypothetical protein M3Y98_01077300 [Aphelenchoides besseyi]|nr:hypothetical protein M3Y98_01077300 [Aphelenchoides besseyi]KAI6209552.1 hypothetical protein M3Y96_00233100 [Aphelenchoides besseyi]
MSQSNNADHVSNDHEHSAHVSDYFRDHSVRNVDENRDEMLALFLAEYAVEMGVNYTDAFQRKPRVTEETLNSFPIVENQKLSKSGCTVCLEDFMSIEESNKVIELPCHHQFHRLCIGQWLREATNCPTCRDDLPTDDPVFESFKKRQKQKKLLQADIDELHDSMYS